MNSSNDLLRGELERLFELEEMKRLSADLLGYDPEEVGGTSGKGAFARALVERCASDFGLEALADAIVLTGRDRVVSDLPGRLADDGELAAGTLVGGLRIARKLGSGGLGVVYVAERGTGDNGSKQRVALKVIHSVHARDRAAVQRFLTGVRALKALGARHIAPVLDVGSLPDGRPWVATAYVEGQTLAARIARTGPMHMNELRPVVSHVLEGLRALHAKGIAHGNVKAENVFMVREGEGEPQGVLVDAGADRLFATPASTDAMAASLLPLFGTAKAFDPELARGRGATPQADLYAVGTLLYEVLTGRPPFTGECAIDVVAQHLTTPPAPPSTLAPKGWVSPELDALVLRALGKRASDRFASADELFAALDHLARQAAEAKAASALDRPSFDEAHRKLLERPDEEERAVALERVVEGAGAWSEAVKALGAAVESAKKPKAKIALLFRIARIEEAELRDLKAAEATYHKVLELDGENEIARMGIEELKRRGGDAESLVELLLERVEHEEGAAERANILREVAHLYEEKLHSRENACVAWVQVLADEPHDERAAREVERLAATPEQWNDAVTTLSEAVQGTEDPAAQVRLYVLMGRWYSTQLKRLDFALQCFGQAVALDPRNDAAYEGTIDLYRRAQSWADLVTVLTARADAASGPAQARDHRAEAAEVLMRRIGDTDRALALLHDVVAADPAHPRANELLEEVLSQRGQWRELAELLDRRANGQRGEAKVETLVHLGEICEDRLSDVDQAIAHFEAALAHDPRHLAALKGLERLYARMGKFDALLANLRAQLELSATPRQKIALYERMGSILEEEFVDRDQAIACFEQIVAIEPGHEVANAALGRLYRQTHRFDDLVDTLERHARASDAPPRKLELTMQAVQVLMNDVGAPARAAAACEKVLAIDPQHSEALVLMARLRSDAGDTQAAVVAVEQLARAEKDPAKRAKLWVQAGKLLEDKGDRDGAIRHYKTALDSDQHNTEATAALRAVYAARGDAHGAAELIERELAVTEGASGRAQLLAEKGQLLRDRLGEPLKARDAFRKALELDPTCTPAALGLGDLAFADGNHADAVRYYEPLLARTGQLAKDVARDVCVRCGDAFRAVGDLDKAQRAYLNAKAFAPEDRAVLEKVADVVFEAGEPDEAAELYRSIQERFAHDLVGGEKGRVLYRLGESLRRAGTLGEAATHLNEAAELLSELPGPLHSLKELYASLGKWPKVVETLRRRTHHAEDEERYALLMEIGDIYLEKIRDKAEAERAYVEALEIRADDRNLLTKLMAVYSEAKDWGRLVDVVLRIASLVDDPRQLGKYYLTAAAISHREIGDLATANAHYARALDADPSVDKAFEGLVETFDKLGDYVSLAGAYRAHIDRLSATAAPERLAQLWDSLGEIMENRLDRRDEAIAAYEHAEVADPENRRRTEQLATMYEAEPKRYFQKAVETHERLLHMSPFRAESYRALRNLYSELGMADEAFCVCQAMKALNIAEPDEEAYVKANRSKSPAAAQEFIAGDLWHRYVAHPTQDPLLTAIFEVITPAVIATRSQPHKSFGVDANQRRDAENDPAAMAKMLHFVAGVTEIPLPDVFYRQNDAGGLSFVFSNPPGIGLGQGALAGGPSQALAFVAGRHLGYFRGGLFLRHLVPTGSGLRAWLLAAIKTVTPQFPIPPDLAGSVQEHMAAFKQHLSGPEQDRLASLVHKLIAAAPELDMKRWITAVDLTADRLGLVLANNLEIALAIVRASPEDSAAVGQKDRLKELHLYAVSRQYLELRQKLGIAIS